MQQRTFAEEGFERFRKPTRQEPLFEAMNRVIPCSDLCAVIEPFYPRAKGAGRPPIGVERIFGFTKVR